MEEITAFVLAGGNSTRMGTDKALLDWQGRSLIEHALTLAGGVAGEVRIVGPRAKFARFGTVVEDLYARRGPLAAIHAALAGSSTDLNLVLAVDMPFIPAKLLEYLTGQARRTDAVVTVPRINGRWQPLCAVYRRNFGTVAEAALRAGRNKIDALFPAVELRVIDETELERLLLDERIFDNLNTRDDWQRARARQGRP